MVDITDGAVLHKLPAGGPSLRRFRESAGLTQVDVAEAFGVSQPAVAQWEKRNDPPGDVWPRLAVVLGVAEPYPLAPFEPARRREWFAARNAGLAPSPPPSGVFGQGKPPEGAG